ncbi:piggyBac transposable element-derived protein 3-like [Eriocheir sinensis]|uniref:piggyBac transposable element-derived protein 3-like n=1 Tax=Eriocheir sinensis TaxID=95602 RepID=UPI0021C9D2B6|nr:piggyBac transposable element-derived protein 3-like [Eriocheir sinensis]
MDEISNIPSTTFYGRQIDRLRARDQEYAQEINLENEESDVEPEEEEVDDPVMPTNLLTDTAQTEDIHAERATFDAEAYLPLSEDDTVVLEVAEATVENEEAPQVTARRARANARTSTSWVPSDHNDVTNNYSYLGPDHEYADDLRQPIEYVRQFLTDDLLDLFVTQSNLYSVQKNPNKPLNVDRNELEQWIGLCIYFSISKLPNVRMHWSHHLGDMRDVTSTVMSRNRWELIKTNFHMVDNSTETQNSRENKDRLFKVRPMVDHLREKFHQIPMEQELCIDEQMVPFKGRSYLKQYVPSKPHKYGYKFFVLAGKDGMTHDFIPYTGKINPVNDPTVPDLGPSSNVVLHLCQIIPSDCNHYLFFDNWFTSLPLLRHLATRKIWCCGTVRQARLPGIKKGKHDEKDLMKKGRVLMKN